MNQLNGISEQICHGDGEKEEMNNKPKMNQTSLTWDRKRMFGAAPLAATCLKEVPRDSASSTLLIVPFSKSSSATIFPSSSFSHAIKQFPTKTKPMTNKNDLLLSGANIISTHFSSSATTTPSKNNPVQQVSVLPQECSSNEKEGKLPRNNSFAEFILRNLR